MTLRTLLNCPSDSCSYSSNYHLVTPRDRTHPPPSVCPITHRAHLHAASRRRHANVPLARIVPTCFNVNLPELSVSYASVGSVRVCGCFRSTRIREDFFTPTALDFMYRMTFEELNGDYSQERMDSVAKALEEVLTSALPQGAITVGVYEAAKSLNVDPDNVVLCVLATDEDEVKDVALQIHFTLIQAFCCENDINILRVNSTRRLAQILAGGGGKQSGGEPLDLHCVLVSSPHLTSWKDPALSKLSRFCRESRGMDQWVPIINLPER